MSEREITRLEEMGIYSDISEYGTAAVVELALFVSSLFDKLGNPGLTCEEVAHAKKVA